MNLDEQTLRKQISYFGRSLFERCYTAGSSGNISVRLENGWLMTPTNCCLGNLKPDNISFLDNEGNHISGDAPSKEFFLHEAFLSKRPQDSAVVHLHSPYATAISCLQDADPLNMLPPLTPYSIMRFGKLALAPYFRPGDKRLGEEIAKLAPTYNAVLLANHGPVVSGKTLESAVYAIEELEETAKLFINLKGHSVRLLNEDQIEELHRVFGEKQESDDKSCC